MWETAIVFLTFFLIDLVIAIWIYSDANSRGYNTGDKIILTSLALIPILGLIFWLIIRKERKEVLKDYKVARQREKKFRKSALGKLCYQIEDVTNKVLKSVLKWSLIGFFIVVIVLILGFIFIGTFLIGALYGLYGSNAPNNYQNTPSNDNSYTTSAIPSQSPQVEPQIPTKLETVENILKDYHTSHTYSSYDLFVCSDMAIDVWNMVKTAGINAKIAVGNVDKQNADITEYNHAWVLAEVEPLNWLALETTGGYVVYGSENMNYYHGPTFENPSKFKRYMELMKTFYTQNVTMTNLENEYEICVAEYESYRTFYNDNYANRQLSPSEISAAMEARDNVAQKLGECNGLSNQLQEEINDATNTVSEIKGLIE